MFKYQVTSYRSVPADLSPEDEHFTSNPLEAPAPVGRTSSSVRGPSQSGMSNRRQRSPTPLGGNLIDLSDDIPLPPATVPRPARTSRRGTNQGGSFGGDVELATITRTSNLEPDPFDELAQRSLTTEPRSTSQPNLFSPRRQTKPDGVDDAPGAGPLHRAYEVPGQVAADRGSGSGPASTSTLKNSQSEGTDVGYSYDSRELHIYAVPLIKDKLVYLPVCTWRDDPDKSTIAGRVVGGISSVSSSMSNMWEGLGRGTPGSIGHRLYKAGQAVLENMNAEERLMKGIPRRATKLIIHHPTSTPADHVQDELTTLTEQFYVKSAGKAAVAGVMLPVAVGLEVLMVPGVGWFTAYQLFKSSAAAAGGSRLNNYLHSSRMDVRICYVAEPILDTYALRSRLSPDGLLGEDDIEDLAHELRAPDLTHPLTQLRQRRLHKDGAGGADGYALLPLVPPEGEGGGRMKDD